MSSEPASWKNGKGLATLATPWKRFVCMRNGISDPYALIGYITCSDISLSHARWSVLEREVMGQNKAEILFHILILKQICKSCQSFSGSKKICIFPKTSYFFFFF